jgi:hypothetical protein
MTVGPMLKRKVHRPERDDMGKGQLHATFNTCIIIMSLR